MPCVQWYFRSGDLQELIVDQCPKSEGARGRRVIQSGPDSRDSPESEQILTPNLGFPGRIEESCSTLSTTVFGIFKIS
jgi:hypothetical protein